MNEVMKKVFEALHEWAHRRGEYTLRDAIAKCLEDKADEKKNEKKK